MTMTSYYTLGRSGLRVSRLALGTMTFGTEWGWGSDENNARQMFNTYLDAGGNLIDTADLYTNGTSETWVGKFVAERKVRDKVAIATKFSFNAEPGNPNAGGNGRKNMMRAVEGSLRRLGTDYIDLYLLHAWDRLTPIEEVMRTFDDLVRSGKVRYVGFSDVPAWYAAMGAMRARLQNTEAPIALQLEYSLVERNLEREFVDLGREAGMGILVWSPLASGLLSGKYRPSQDGRFGEGRLQTLKGSGNPGFEKFSERNFAIVAALEDVAGKVGRSMSQVALNWVANRPGVASVLIGASKLTQLQDNLSALDFEIPAELLAQLDAASRPESQFPYTFFESALQGMIHGGVTVGNHHARYRSPIVMSGPGAGVQ